MQVEPPIPLVHFEHYLYADDRPETPMAFYLRATFRGLFQRRAFARAVVKAQSRHPLTRAVVSGSSKNRTPALKWLEARNPTPYIKFGSLSDSVTFPNDDPYIDLTREVGLRFFVREREEKTELLMQAHHSVIDAIGAKRFIEDILGEYCNETSGGREGPIRAVDPSQLPVRGDFGLSTFDKIRRTPWDLRRLPQLFSTDPEPIATGTEFDRSRRLGDFEFPSHLHRSLSPERLLFLRQLGANTGSTLNDVWLRDLFVAIHTFNLQHDEEYTIRLAMPVNLRNQREDAMSAANVTSMAFLDRSPTDLDDPERLLASITRETRLIKERRLGITLCRALSLIGRFTGGLRSVCDLKRCYSTAVLSNLGRPFVNSPLMGADGKVHAGNVTLERFELLPPVRPLTYAAFGVVTYGDETTISMNFDPRALTAAAAEHLLNTFVAT